MHLPVANVLDVAAGAVVTPQLLRGHGETVLLVDDEESIRVTLQVLLERQNYRVVAARNGGEALFTFAKQQDAVKVVVIDMMMPVVGGRLCVSCGR